MTKKKTNRRPIIIGSVSAAISIGLIICSYFIGRNKGYETGIQHERDSYIAAMEEESNKIEGVYKRSFYNNYNKSVESYVVLREDQSCKYISMVASEYSTSVDLNNGAPNCTYTISENKKSGIITIKRIYEINGVEKEDDPTTIDFTIGKYGMIMIGGASYSKIQT